MDQENKRERVLRLFSFLKELTQLKTTVVKNIDQYDQTVWISDIPREVGCFSRAWGSADDDDANKWIQIKKPKRVAPPQVPPQLASWVVEADLKDSSSQPKLMDTIMVSSEKEPESPPLFLSLAEQPSVQYEWSRYLEESWHPWAKIDQRLAKVEQVYLELFTMQQKQQKLGEAYEVVLGFGFFQWQEKQAPIRRHIVTARAYLTLDSQRGVITVSHPVEGAKLEIEQEMVQPDVQPSPDELDLIDSILKDLGDDVWDARLRQALKVWTNAQSAAGEYIDELGAISGTKDRPTVTFAPALILRKKNDRSFIRLYQEIVNQLKGGADLPLGVERLVQVVDDNSNSDSGSSLDQTLDPREEIFFPLPANREQREIAEKIRTKQGVVVQGPPGTGKSHTIANLVCHLLATGQRVLVTSHTPRALKVLKDKFPDEISALCVSLLGDDHDGMRSLEDSVTGITEKFNDWDSRKNEGNINLYTEALRDTRSRIAHTLNRMRSLREKETYKYPEVFGRYSGTLAAIAKKATEEANVTPVLPGPLVGDLCPLTINESQLLYDLCQKIPNLPIEDFSLNPEIAANIPSPDKFGKMCSDLSHAEIRLLGREATKSNSDLSAIASLPKAERSRLQGAASSVLEQVQEIQRYPYSWIGQMLDQVLSERDRAWKELLGITSEQLTEINKFDKATFDFDVTGLNETTDKTLNDVDGLFRHLKAGGSLGFWKFRSRAVTQALYVVESVRINGRPCTDAQTVGSLLSWLRLSRRIRILAKYWSHLAASANLPARVQVEEYRHFCEPIEAALKLRDYLKANFQQFKSLNLPDWKSVPDISQFILAIDTASLEVAIGEQRAEINKISEQIRMLPEMTIHSALGGIMKACDSRSYEDYLEHVERLRAAIKNKLAYNQFQAFLEILETRCPAVATRVRHFDSGPQGIVLLKTFDASWRLTKVKDWLQSQCDPNLYDELAIALDQSRREEQRLLGELAAEKAWRYCFSRMKEFERQHLMAWAKAVKKIGKGTGKHANKHRADARDAMSKCRSAIPAWIMPLYKVAESVHPGTDIFDVAIIDEASQSGPEALFLHYLAKRIIVVGDDKQISPDSWIDREKVQALREKWIKDLPHSNHIGVDDSFFDLAQIRFSGRIRLREHFRCMPEIIQFSNDLCYQSEPLIPLKQYGSSRLAPTVIARHVPDGYREGSSSKTWNPPEADAIVAQIKACIADPAYEDKTIGVISLLGEIQANQINHKLLEAIGPEEMERREIVCGDAYAFQGDERDIMFISLVSAPAEGHTIGVLNKASDERRINVAASRAIEQMWLFHTATLNDLNPKCLRHKFLRYCMSPTRVRQDIEGLNVEDLRRLSYRLDRTVSPAPSPFDSWFEVDVFFKIHDQGYRVIPQYPIAGKRIDLVIEGKDGRLAIECDGDYWHAGSQKFEEDTARQRDLERCGLQFVRVQESIFYLGKDKAMEPTWEALVAKGIYPEGPNADSFLEKYKPSAPPSINVNVKHAPMGFSEGAAAVALNHDFFDVQNANKQRIEIVQPIPTLKSAPEIEFKLTKDDLKNISLWNAKSKRMTNSYEKVLLSAMEKFVHLSTSAREVPEDILKGAKAGLARAISLGFKRSEKY